MDENIGLCTLATTDNYVSMIMMKELDELCYVKLDVLGLDNIGVINETCKLANIERLTPDNIDLNDEKVWKAIRDDTSMIFQMESSSAQAYIKQLFSDETIKKIREKNPNMSWLELFSFVNGAIRPSGASFRDMAATGEFKDNGFKELNEFLYDTLGYCLLQEQIMLFLVKFCGYSMAESDTVRRGIAKKGGTELFIPEIKRRFLEYTPKKYNISLELAEKVIEPFLQIILDANGYGFSKNHNTPYSIIGYACGWLREYYPLEFCTACLNTWSDDEDKTLNIIKYLKKRNISLNPPLFRYSKAEYFFDKKSNSIYQGVASIKHLNEKVGNELYELRNNDYSSFIDLLDDIKEKTSCNSKQLEILIKMDYFKEFGHSNFLLEIARLYDIWRNRKEITKTKAIELGIDIEWLKTKGKETEKKISQLNGYEILQELVKKINVKTTIKDRIQYDYETKGYSTVKYPQHKDKAMVIDVETTYLPKLKLYLIDQGKEISIKIYKTTFAKEPLKAFDIIEIGGYDIRPKSKKVEGKWIPTEEKETWLRGYKKLNK